MSSATIETVLAWHMALNAGDVERVIALSTADVEVGGPRGAGRGADLLRDWVSRADIRLEPGRMFAGPSTVVVAEAARWQASEDRQTEPQAVATLFRFAGERVSSVIRFPDLASALQAAGLQESDEYLPG